MTTRVARLLVLFGLIAGLCVTPREPASATGPARDASAEPGAGHSCGALALALFGRLQGLAWDPAEVDRRLGPDSGPGHSMAQLIRTANAMGLSLRGVRLDPAAWPMSGPAILHLQRGRAGHFVVIRPVGQSGRLVQLLDPPSTSEVLELDRLARSPEWTGAAIVARPAFGASPWGLLVAGAAFVLVGIAAMRTRDRSRRVGEHS
ncbi:cysteine peptidase family C39 domain-containing protein [Tautonia sociabilis]|uniref:Peptidase C39 domain-containing protein n=1 Tax=Tautonia sociabilis TaxID=2080755 RepID=A0A432MCT7_9BACT|nr:cysteine peptidase family C39 domain-containing protein [Tautonia sociabilis]RUL81427.1 hypothetical protein TsocGM_25020 [Tautonia sociabilis]